MLPLKTDHLPDSRTIWQIYQISKLLATEPQLARCIFFANQGKFQVGDYEEIMNKASCLSLVSNAVLYWNTMRMTEIITQLKNNGEVISDNTLTHISLLPHKHLITMGTYFTDAAIDQSEIEDVGEFTVL